MCYICVLHPSQWIPVWRMLTQCCSGVGRACWSTGEARAAADLILPTCPRHEGDRLGDPVVGSPTVSLEVVR